MTHQQTDLLIRVAKALPDRYRLPKFTFDPNTIEWEASNDLGEGIGQSLEESLFHWAENAKSIREATYGEGYKWDAALKVMESYAPPIDTTYPITFTETGL